MGKRKQVSRWLLCQYNSSNSQSACFVSFNRYQTYQYTSISKRNGNEIIMLSIPDNHSHYAPLPVNKYFSLFLSAYGRSDQCTYIHSNFRFIVRQPLYLLSFDMSLPRCCAFSTSSNSIMSDSIENRFRINLNAINFIYQMCLWNYGSHSFI